MSFPVLHSVLCCAVGDSTDVANDDDDDDDVDIDVHAVNVADGIDENSKNVEFDYDCALIPFHL